MKAEKKSDFIVYETVAAYNIMQKTNQAVGLRHRRGATLPLPADNQGDSEVGSMKGWRDFIGYGLYGLGSKSGHWAQVGWAIMSNIPLPEMRTVRGISWTISLRRSHSGQNMQSVGFLRSVMMYLSSSVRGVTECAKESPHGLTTDRREGQSQESLWGL
jgi:hypothetical protein